MSSGLGPIKTPSTKCVLRASSCPRVVWIQGGPALGTGQSPELTWWFSFMLVSSSLVRVAHTFSVSELLSCDVYSNTVRSRGNILTRCLVRASFKEAWEGYSVGGGYPTRPCGTRNLSFKLSQLSRQGMITYLPIEHVCRVNVSSLFQDNCIWTASIGTWTFSK